MGVTTVIRDHGSDIVDAIRDGDDTKFKAIVARQLKKDQQVARLCTTDIRHRTTGRNSCPILLASRLDDPAILIYMLSRGVDASYRHHAVFAGGGRHEVETPLLTAVGHGCTDNVSALLMAHADMSIGDQDGCTPLHVAVQRDDAAITRLLLTRGADTDAVNTAGNTALHIASRHGNTHIVNLLLQHGADPCSGETAAILLAAHQDHVHLLRLYCDTHSAVASAKLPSNGQQRAALHVAADRGHYTCVRMLVEDFGVDASLTDAVSDDGNTGGGTALHCLVGKYHDSLTMRPIDDFTTTARHLLRARVAINAHDRHGDTALHLAAANRYGRIVDLLLALGANPGAQDACGRKPVDVAKEAVTKHVLSQAMLHPIANVSAESLRHEILATPAPTPAPTPAQTPAQTPLMEKRPTVIDRSQSNTSTASLPSVFDDSKDQTIPLPATPAVYKPVERKAKRASKTKTSVNTLLSAKSTHHDSDSSLSSIATTDLVTTAMDKKLKKRMARDQQDDESYMPMVPRVKKLGGSNLPRRKPPMPPPEEKDEVIYENSMEVAKRQRASPIYANASQLAKVEGKMANGTDPLDGVQVHKIGGKPDLIEVSYDGGPITISVDTSAQDSTGKIDQLAIENVTDSESSKVTVPLGSTSVQAGQPGYIDEHGKFVPIIGFVGQPWISGQGGGKLVVGKDGKLVMEPASSSPVPIGGQPIKGVQGQIIQGSDSMLQLQGVVPVEQEDEQQMKLKEELERQQQLVTEQQQLLQQQQEQLKLEQEQLQKDQQQKQKALHEKLQMQQQKLEELHKQQQLQKEKQQQQEKLQQQKLKQEQLQEQIDSEKAKEKFQQEKFRQEIDRQQQLVAEQQRKLEEEQTKLKLQQEKLESEKYEQEKHQKILQEKLQHERDQLDQQTKLQQLQQKQQKQQMELQKQMQEQKQKEALEREKQKLEQQQKAEFELQKEKLAQKQKEEFELQKEKLAQKQKEELEKQKQQFAQKREMEQQKLMDEEPLPPRKMKPHVPQKSYHLKSRKGQRNHAIAIEKADPDTEPMEEQSPYKEDIAIAARTIAMTADGEVSRDSLSVSINSEADSTAGSIRLTPVIQAIHNKVMESTEDVAAASPSRPATLPMKDASPDDEVSPDVSPNASPQYKSFQQALAWAKQREKPMTKTIVATPEVSRWKVKPNTHSTVVESAQTVTVEQHDTSVDDDVELTESDSDDDAEDSDDNDGGGGDDNESVGEDNHSASDNKDSSGDDNDSAGDNNDSAGDDDDDEHFQVSPISNEKPQYPHPTQIVQKSKVEFEHMPAEKVSAESTEVYQSVIENNNRVQLASDFVFQQHKRMDSDSSEGLSSRTYSTESVISEGGTRYLGLNMHVTGEAPKTYSHAGKAAARKAFMQATPIGIESGSEASDNELSGSRSSLGSFSPATSGRSWPDVKPVYGTQMQQSAAAVVQLKEVLHKEIPTSEQPQTPTRTSKLIGSYARPYRSFGLIETNTDAIDEAMEELMTTPGSMSYDDVFAAEDRRFATAMRTFSASDTDLSSEPTAPTKTWMDRMGSCDTTENKKKNQDDHAKNERNLKSSPKSNLRSDVKQARVMSPKTVTFAEAQTTVEVPVTSGIVTTTVKQQEQPTEVDIVMTEDLKDSDEVAEDELVESYTEEPRLIHPKKIVGVPTPFVHLLHDEEYNNKPKDAQDRQNQQVEVERQEHVEKQRKQQIEREKEQLEREREQAERERQQRIENERQQQLNKEQQQQIERERQKQANRERNEQQERERRKKLEEERQQKLQRERQQVERERKEQQECERQQKLEKERKQQIERERQQQAERERKEEQERDQQHKLEKEKQQQIERERQQKEKELKEQQERERQQKMEKERQQQLERERERKEQQEMEKQQMLENERRQVEIERQQQVARERKEQQERERQQKLEMDRQQQLEIEREQLEKEEQQRLEREIHEQERVRQQQIENDRLELERQDQIEKERQQKLEHDQKLLQEHQSQQQYRDQEKERQQQLMREHEKQLQQQMEEQKKRLEQQSLNQIEQQQLLIQQQLEKQEQRLQQQMERHQSSFGSAEDIMQYAEEPGSRRRQHRHRGQEQQSRQPEENLQQEIAQNQQQKQEGQRQEAKQLPQQMQEDQNRQKEEHQRLQQQEMQIKEQQEQQYEQQYQQEEEQYVAQQQPQQQQQQPDEQLEIKHNYQQYQQEEEQYVAQQQQQQQQPDEHELQQNFPQREQPVASHAPVEPIYMNIPARQHVQHDNHRNNLLRNYSIPQNQEPPHTAVSAEQYYDAEPMLQPNGEEPYINAEDGLPVNQEQLMYIQPAALQLPTTRPMDTSQEVQPVSPTIQESRGKAKKKRGFLNFSSGRRKKSHGTSRTSVTSVTSVEGDVPQGTSEPQPETAPEMTPSPKGIEATVMGSALQRTDTVRRSDYRPEPPRIRDAAETDIDADLHLGADDQQAPSRPQHDKSEEALPPLSLEQVAMASVTAGLKSPHAVATDHWQDEREQQEEMRRILESTKTEPQTEEFRTEPHMEIRTEPHMEAFRRDEQEPLPPADGSLPMERARPPSARHPRSPTCVDRKASHHGNASNGGYPNNSGKSLQQVAMETIGADLRGGRQPQGLASAHAGVGTYHPRPGPDWEECSNESQGPPNASTRPLDKSRSKSENVFWPKSSNQEQRRASSDALSEGTSPASQKRVTIRDQRRRPSRQRRDLAPQVTSPGPVDFSQYNSLARLWMEQVDANTVQKSNTMYLAIAPENAPPAPNANTVNVSPAHWVIARGRSIRSEKRRRDERLSSSFSIGEMGDVTGGGPRSLLYFHVTSTSWRDMAWILFDGAQSDTDTLRMLADVELKHPGKLNEQVQDVMHRWWQSQGSAATIERLRDALNFARLPYIHDDDAPNLHQGEPLGELDDSDPNIGRLMRSYGERSFDASVEYARTSRTSLPRPQERSYDYDSDGVVIGDDSEDYDDGGPRPFVIVQPQLRPVDYRHETTL